MSIHVLKTWPEPFEAVVAGTKRHEARKNDRLFAVGDLLVLTEWIPNVPELFDGQASDGVLTGSYTGRSTTVRVTYITPGGAYRLPRDLCVMSISHQVKP